jgi:plastocyanin
MIMTGCGGAATAAPLTPGPTTPAPASPGPTTPGSATALPAARCPEVPEPTGTLCFTITIRDFAFDPPALTVPTSARIVFVNEDDALHSIAWADGTPTSPTLAKGASTERILGEAAPGTLDYRCGIHASMRGSIVVDATLPVP